MTSDMPASPHPSGEAITSGGLILKPLAMADADAYYQMYSSQYTHEDTPFLPNETPVGFTGRIITACTYAFTIREEAKPNTIVGDCALHHWNKQENEIEVGGLLLPHCWGKGLMKEAFAILYEIASVHLQVNVVLGSTSVNNAKAIRFAEKDGFVQYKLNNGMMILKKDLERR